MAYAMYPEGTFDRIRDFLVRQVPRGSEVRWVTFVFYPSERLLALLLERDLKAVVICRHPTEAARGESYFSVRAWDRLQRYPGAIYRVLGLRDGRYADGEHDYGFLHAKFIVAKHPGQERYSLLTGSFNLSEGSLHANCEHCHETTNEEDTKQAWRDAENLARVAFEITARDECNDDERHVPVRLQPKDGPARVAPRDVRRAPKPPPPTEPYSPDGLRLLAQALDQMLCSWPPDGPNRQWQWDVFCQLQQRNRRTDLLYLPVGVGKTFIALRWLLWQVDAARRERGALLPGLFLAPNSWAALTICRDIEMVAQAAERLAAAEGKRPPRYADFVKVCNPAQAREWTSVAALVADEVHNWNPRSDTTEAPNYSGLLNRWRDEVPVLGVSATPCRVDDGAFSVHSFVSNFLASSYSEEETHAGLGLRAAFEMKLLTPPRYQRLAVDAQGRIDQILQYDDGTAIRWGDYGVATLRSVWEELAGTRNARRHLVGEILDAIQQHRARRVVVFLPPVEQAADSFVDALRAALVSSGAPDLLDFRSCSSSTDSEARATFQRFADPQTGRPGKPAVIVTIDRFAEGISVPDIDMLIMLRATLSPRVAVQALGRGLRKFPGKRHCIVLDAVQFKARLELWEADVLGDGVLKSPAASNADGITESGPARATVRSRGVPSMLGGFTGPLARTDTSSERKTRAAGTETRDGQAVDDELPAEWNALPRELLDWTVAEVREGTPEVAEHLAEILRLPLAKVRRKLKETRGNTKIQNVFDMPLWLIALDDASEALATLAARTVGDLRRELAGDPQDEPPLVEQLIAAGFSKRSLREVASSDAHGNSCLDRVLEWPDSPSSAMLRSLLAQYIE